MGMLDDVLGSAVPKGSLSKPLMIALMALLASGALHRSASAAPSAAGAAPSGDGGGLLGGGLLGGLGGLLERFQQSGQGDIIKSWIGGGPNASISPTQMGSALGPEIIKMLAQKTGLPEQELQTQLSQLLPGIVDKLTPAGRLPTPAEVGHV